MKKLLLAFLLTIVTILVVSLKSGVDGGNLTLAQKPPNSEPRAAFAVSLFHPQTTEPTSDPIPATTSEQPAESGPESRPVPPKTENDRILGILRASGPARNDHLDQVGSLTANKLLQKIKEASPDALLDEFECHAAGCLVTVSLPIDQYRSARDFLDAADRTGVMRDWPGPRVYPPLLRQDRTATIHMVLVRPDTTTAF